LIIFLLPVYSLVNISYVSYASEQDWPSLFQLQAL